jgi:hypothetical protein
VASLATYSAEDVRHWLSYPDCITAVAAAMAIRSLDAREHV